MNAHWQWVWSVAIFFVALVLFSLTLLIATRKRQCYILIFSALVFSLMLGGERWYAMVLALMIAFLLAQVGVFVVKDEQRQRIKINLFRTLKRGMPLFGTALSLILASGFYFSLINNQKLDQAPRVEVEIPPVLNKIGLNFAKLIIPSAEVDLLDENITVDQFLQQGIAGQQEQMLPEGFDPSQLEGEMLAEFNDSQQDVLKEAKDKLSEQIGFPLKGDEVVSDVVGQIINKQINTLINGQDEVSKSLLPATVALAIFITARSVFWLLLFPVLWTAAGIFAMMRRFGWIEIKKEMKEVEIIV